MASKPKINGQNIGNRIHRNVIEPVTQTMDDEDTTKTSGVFGRRHYMTD